MPLVILQRDAPGVPCRVELDLNAIGIAAQAGFVGPRQKSPRSTRLPVGHGRKRCVGVVKVIEQAFARIRVVLQAFARGPAA